MRFVRFIFSLIALAAGVLIAVFFIAVGLVVFGIRRLLGRPATMPAFRRASATPASARTNRVDHSDVIDVETTQVK
ncbi:hypothetical protein [Oleiharenicola lentus]|uniref:hypothetical protein n=1 Tax=Oleiharenicola lentus TaxID=2508720 RepID=UPI003F677308